MTKAVLKMLGASAVVSVLLCGSALADGFDTCTISRGFHIQKDFGEDGPYIQFGTQAPKLFIVRTSPGVTGNSFISGNAGPGVNVTQGEFDWISHVVDLRQGKSLTVNWSLDPSGPFVWIEYAKDAPCP